MHRHTTFYGDRCYTLNPKPRTYNIASYSGPCNTQSAQDIWNPKVDTTQLLGQLRIIRRGFGGYIMGIIWHNNTGVIRREIIVSSSGLRMSGSHRSSHIGLRELLGGKLPQSRDEGMPHLDFPRTP